MKKWLSLAMVVCAIASCFQKAVHFLVKSEAVISKIDKFLIETCQFLVPLTGLEPVRYFYRGILSPLRLPIPPQRHIYTHIKNKGKLCTAKMQSFLEAPPGFEPGDKGFADLGLTTWL